MFMTARPHAGIAAAFALAGLLASMTAAGAATLNIERYDRGEIGAAHTAMAGFLSSHALTGDDVETFDGKAAWNGASGTSNPQNTKVGSFSSIGGTGAGASAIHGGNGLEVRNDNAMAWGRHDTDALAKDMLGGKWLDSNDTYGMKWDISGLGAFNAVAFFLTDVADVGGKFSIKVGETLYSNIIGSSGNLKNGNVHLVQILLPKAVQSLTVELFNDRLNDGFGLDGAAVAKVAPVPVPPAMLLLGTGIAALAGLRRRRSAARA